MRWPRRRLTGAVVLAASLAHASVVQAVPYEQQSAVRRALYTGIAMVANVMPVVSAIYAPRCLPGYVVCKVAFAGISLIAAADQLALSGDADLTQTRGILYRGFRGDWFLTGEHVSGDKTPQPLPDPPPPPAEEGEGTWQPPPL